jgi:ankyrin repeat protein
VACLLDLGVDVRTPFAEGDGYFGIRPNSQAIHVAAWQLRPAVVRLLIRRGAPVDLPDPNGVTPLALAARASVESYWTERCSPDLMNDLIRAGASVRHVPYPTGDARVDAVLAAHRGDPFFP